MKATTQVCFRSALIDCQLITRERGRRLGVVSQVWCDVDAWQVVALDIKDSLVNNYLPGEPTHSVRLQHVRQIGDVVLVEDDRVLEELDPLPYTRLVGSEVVTETGEFLGKVRDFEFAVEQGRISHLVIDSLGVPRVPSRFLSTYELSVDEVVSVGADKLIVFEGAEERLNQLTRGWLEAVGIGKPPWEREDDPNYLPTPVSYENRLGSGTPTNNERRRARPEEDWAEPEELPVRPARKTPRRVESAYVEPLEAEPLEVDLETDAWAEAEPYQPPMNLPQRQYEEESN
ncbi:PRC-barrel domain-containing protein [Gloeomargarita lithophora Alchichica-D10]|uniref:PRC-barrel domain-containing protein n=1 Tax=Gloeomargarita lithophora Alchichica-D10 TaxID=1188229 RepID=A0A1J0AEK2_9CYAN|nr:PRC-barrel domain-containing protein [Gloeomargarita lithophora]APB34361.1 PRC-barrel domain-containing protein [Gloeomargarita lithophora Alchichica-D10]